MLSRVEMFKVPVSVMEQAKKEVETNGYRMLACKRYSAHPDDSHLYVVLAVIETSDLKQFVTWLYNYDFGALNHGHYIIDQEQAEKDYYEREHQMW